MTREQISGTFLDSRVYSHRSFLQRLCLCWYRTMMNRLWLLIFVFAALSHAHADVALLLEEPYGFFGSMNPTGHAAIYLPEVCSVTPTELRRCVPGEGGVVISRYRKVAGYDWLAIPLVPYLYAVDTLEEIPASTDKHTVEMLRDQYRREHLTELIPNDSHGRMPKGDWTQLVGEAYIRRMYGFRIKTTQAQDDAFIAYFNARRNISDFSLFFSNCADLAREVLNFYEPHAIHRNFLSDAGITTPKQVARSLTKYAHRHPELELTSFEINQVPGTIKRSHSVDSVAEALVKSKKYLIPLAILSPITTGSIGVAYLAGRFNPHKNAQPFDIASVVKEPIRNNGRTLALASSPENRASSAKGIQLDLDLGDDLVDFK